MSDDVRQVAELHDRLHASGLFPQANAVANATGVGTVVKAAPPELEFAEWEGEDPHPVEDGFAWYHATGPGAGERGFLFPAPADADDDALRHHARKAQAAALVP